MALVITLGVAFCQTVKNRIVNDKRYSSLLRIENESDQPAKYELRGIDKEFI